MGLPSALEWAGSLSRVAPGLFEAAVRSVVVLGVAGVVTAAMRRASAAARYFVWMLGIAGVLALPVMTAVLPPAYVLRAGSASPRAAANPSAPLQAPIEKTEGPAVSAAAGNGEQKSALEGNVNVASAVTPAEKEIAVTPTPAIAAHEIAPAAAVSAAVAPIAATGTASGAAHAAAIPWPLWLVFGWLIGCVLVLGHMLLGFVSLWLLERRAAHVHDGAWNELLAELSENMGIARRVKLLVTPRRTMPMTWGLVRPRLLLPEQAGEWSPEQRRAVLLHELGHVWRRDCLTQCVTQVACALYWFNPLVWVAWHRVQVERERACDDLVLNTGARASGYAAHLLTSATAARGLHFVGAAVAMARPSTLEERVKAILDGRRNRRGFSRPMAVATVILCAGLLVPVAALRGQESPGAPQPQTPPQAVPQPARGTVGTGGRGGRGGFSGGGGGLMGGGIGGGMGPGPGPAGGMGSLPMPGPDASPTCSLDATIYEVHLDASKIGQIDPDALTKAAAAANAAEFEQFVGQFGKPKPLYRAHQSVRLSGDSIDIGTNVPYITNSQVTNAGNTINSVAYREVGAVFSVNGRAQPSGSMEIELSIQVSVMGDNGVAITDKVNAPVFRSATMEHRGPVAPGVPFVMMSIDGASTDSEGKAVAYIARVNMGKPEFQAAAPEMPPASASIEERRQGRRTQQTGSATAGN